MAYQTKNIIDADFETSSDVELSGKNGVGAHRYSRDPSTVCYQAWFGFEMDGVHHEVEWRLGWPMPVLLMEAINRGYFIAAHNREFEACIWNNILAKRYGWPPIPIDAGICTATVAAANALPRTLEAVASVRSYPVQKDMFGNAVMKTMMKNWDQPLKRGTTIKNANTGEVIKLVKGDTPSQVPRLRDIVSSYCRDDIRSERQILTDPWIFPLSPFEYRVWQNDCRINWRGVYIDRELLQACIETYEALRQHYQHMLIQLTQGRVESAGSDAAVTAEARLYGIAMVGNTKDVRGDLIKNANTPPAFKTVLNTINALKKVSCTKLYRMRDGVCEDGRLRGMLMMNGAARTGRWASRLLQLQNMTGNADLQDADYALILNFCRARDYRGLMAIYGWGAMDAISWCIRPLICAAPGNELADADFSAIEARVIAWLAGESWRLEFFSFTPDTWPEGREMYFQQLQQGIIQQGDWPLRDGKTFKPDIYIKSYSETFKVPYMEVTNKQRKLGKVEELALGFMGGVGAMLNFGADKLGMSEAEMNQVKNGWRNANPNIQALWYKIEEAAKSAIQNPGWVYDVNNILQYEVRGPYLLCRLPSGRCLHYYSPSIRTEWDSRFERWSEKIYYWGRKSDEGSNESNMWSEIDTYGGKLTENAVQAIARDLMANSLLNAEANGYNTIFHVHDEMVNEQPEGTTDLKAFVQVMSQTPAWAAGMPVTAAGWIGPHFKKD